MVSVDAIALYEHEKVARCDIKPASVEKWRDVEIKQLQKKSFGYPL
jgi:hypothetical protein